MRKTMPFWEDRDYGYEAPREYDFFETRIPQKDDLDLIETVTWRLEYLTEQWLDFARVKQTCLKGCRPEECDAERGGRDCRDCLAKMTASWEPIYFD